MVTCYWCGLTTDSPECACPRCAAGGCHVPMMTVAELARLAQREQQRERRRGVRSLRPGLLMERAEQTRRLMLVCGLCD